MEVATENSDLELIKQLREEANEVKRCVTTYSFAALTFSSAVFAAIAAAADKLEEIWLAGIPVIALLMLVCRIAIYKYSTANRNYGYELHLARLDSFSAEVDPALLRALKRIEWEEALRAWRVVQTAIFRCIYKVPENMKWKFLRFVDWRLYKLKPKWESEAENYKKVIEEASIDNPSCEHAYPWFMPNLLAWDKKEKYSSYHAGTYLQNLITIMVVMQYFLAGLMAFLAFKHSTTIYSVLLYSIAFGLMVVFIFIRQIRIKRRRELLENELLSIHSCGIVWQAVTLAHVLARKKCNGFCEHYTEFLVHECEDIKKKIFEIHNWFNTNMGLT